MYTECTDLVGLLSEKNGMVQVEPLVQCSVYNRRHLWGCYQPALFAWALRAWCHMVGPRKCLLTIGASAELGLLPSSLRKHCENDNIYSPTTFTENLENMGGTLEEEKVGAHVGTAWLFSLPGCTAARCNHTGCCIF